MHVYESVLVKAVLQKIRTINTILLSQKKMPYHNIKSLKLIVAVCKYWKTKAGNILNWVLCGSITKSIAKKLNVNLYIYIYIYELINKWIKVNNNAAPSYQLKKIQKQKKNTKYSQVNKAVDQVFNSLLILSSPRSSLLSFLSRFQNNAKKTKNLSKCRYNELKLILLLVSNFSISFSLSLSPHQLSLSVASFCL